MSDRSRLIRAATKLPKGSAARRTVLASLRAASDEPSIPKALEKHLDALGGKEASARTAASWPPGMDAYLAEWLDSIRLGILTETAFSDWGALKLRAPVSRDTLTFDLFTRDPDTGKSDPEVGTRMKIVLDPLRSSLDISMAVFTNEDLHAKKKYTLSVDTKTPSQVAEYLLAEVETLFESAF